MCVNVVKEALGHSLLKEFVETLQEEDGVVVLASHVVVAAGFGDDNNQSSLPGCSGKSPCYNKPSLRVK